MNILNILASDNYFIYNKDIAKQLGPEAAILIGLFCTRYNYYQKQKMLRIIDTKEYFYCTRETIYDETGLSENIQRKATKILKDSGILEIKKLGIPSKNFYYINQQKLAEIIDNSSTVKSKELDIQKEDNLNFENNSQIIINNNIDLLDNKLSNKGKILENNETNNIDINKQIEEDLEKKKKEAKKAEKVKNAILINQMLEDFTSNLEVQKALKDYLAVRKKKGLTASQWKLILDDLRKECGTNKDYALEKIQKATAGGWLQIIYSNKSSFRSKPSFDNTANHQVPKGVASMTEEEKDDFYENELAKDENGNYLKF